MLLDFRSPGFHIARVVYAVVVVQVSSEHCFLADGPYLPGRRSLPYFRACQGHTSHQSLIGKQITFPDTNRVKRDLG